jgi:3-oxoacyl-[acyl-carrier protein] reductase
MIKNALVIGGSGGIGKAIVENLSGQGIMVFATFFHGNESHEMPKKPENCRFLKMDITNIKEIDQVVDYFDQQDIKIDLIVNCATGSLKLKTFDSLEDKEIREDMEVILMGAVNFFRRILPRLKKNRSGIIINLITEAISDPVPSRMSSYIMAKSGLLGLTKCLAVELAPYEIKIYGLSPYFVETELIKSFPEKLLEIERSKMPDKKFLNPIDIAKAVDIIAVGGLKSGGNIIIHSKEDIARLIGKTV